MVTLSRRFAAAFVLIVVLPSVVVSILLAREYLNALHDSVIQQTEVTAEQVAGHIREDADNAALLAAALIHDEELGDLAAAFASSRSRLGRFRATRRLDDKLVGFFRYTKQVGAVVLFLKGGATYAYSNYPNLRDVASLGRDVYAPAAATPGRIYLLDTLDGVARNIGARNMITLAVCPFARDESPIEAILVSFRVPYLDDLDARWGNDPGSAVVMFGRSGRPLLSTLPGSSDIGALSRLAAVSEGARTPQRELRAAGRTWLATSYPVSSTGWTLFLLADRAAIDRRVTGYQWYLYPALLALAVVFLMYGEYFFARVASPIRRIVRHMSAVGMGDLAVRAEPQQIAELAELAQGFNGMVQRIDELGVERERIERERLSAELDALRYQINPHFVANTLNSIRFMALASNADAIAGMTRDLMRLLADSYSGAEKLIDLSREFDNVKAYIGIMKIRFGERFTACYDSDPAAESMLTLRMVLQPIVENAILHGFSGASADAAPPPGGGVVRITTRIESQELPVAACPEPWARALPGKVMTIEIRDDGSGMDPNKAARLLEESAQPSGLYRIGVANVHRRIRLNFGPPYGLEIESQPGQFTTVRFTLPALERVAIDREPHA